MNTKYRYYWLLLLAPAVLLAWFFLARSKERPLVALPYYGPKNRGMKGDTAYHQVPAFRFVDQYGEDVTEKTVADKIYVSEFFFTTCKSICPVMNRHLDRVYALHKNDPDVLILSHTVDPETDSVPVLLSYARQHGVNNHNWLFVTGKKKELYEMARKGYLLDAGEAPSEGEDFVHTQNFALVDKERHIRGYYDGTDSADVERLIKEITRLKNEYTSEDIRP